MYSLHFGKSWLDALVESSIHKSEECFSLARGLVQKHSLRSEVGKRAEDFGHGHELSLARCIRELRCSEPGGRPTKLALALRMRPFRRRHCVTLRGQETSRASMRFSVQG
jgi:hypothetical protein